jgi:hypothetical protein
VGFVGGGGGDNRSLQAYNEVSQVLCVFCSNLKRKSSKNQLYYLIFLTKFHSRSNGKSLGGPHVVQACFTLLCAERFLATEKEHTESFKEDDPVLGESFH